MDTSSESQTPALAGEVDTLRTREGVPGPPGAGEGGSFASYCGGGWGLLFQVGGPAARVLFPWVGSRVISGRVLTRTEVDSLGGEPARSLEVCLARLQGHRVGTGHRLDWIAAGMR